MEPDRTDLLAFILAAYSLVLPVVAAVVAVLLGLLLLVRWVLG